MLQLNGRIYARNASELKPTRTAPQAEPTPSGFYRVHRGHGRVSVALFTLDRDPVALVSPDGVLVTAFRYNGTTRTTFSLTESTKRELGLEHAPHNTLRTIAADVLRQVA